MKELKDDADDYLKDNFLVKTKNQAGCYPIVMTVNGEQIVVVVDEWFPFYIDHNGEEQFCFARMNPESTRFQKDGKKPFGELWVMLMEKAWAKVCGSYEASEMGTG